MISRSDLADLGSEQSLNLLPVPFKDSFEHPVNLLFLSSSCGNGRLKRSGVKL